MDKQPIFNARHMMQLLAHDSLMIDWQTGMQYFAQYIADIQLAQNSDVLAIIAQRRAAVQPQIISALGAAQVVDAADGGLSNTDIGNGSIAKLFVSGAMMLEGGASSDGIRGFAQQVADANANPKITGILVKMNTGGGEVMAGQEMFNALQDNQKPIIVHGDLIASAGVMGALPASEIILSGAMSRMGSIGTLIQINKEMVEAMKATIDNVYSELSPDKNGDLRAYLGGDRQPLVNAVTAIDKQFMRMVKQHLPVTDAELTGKMYTAKEAVKLGLANSIGTEAFAVQRLGIKMRQFSRRSNSLKIEKMEVFKRMQTAWANYWGTDVVADQTMEEFAEQMETQKPLAEMQAAIAAQVTEDVVDAQVDVSEFAAMQAAVEATQTEVAEIRTIVDGMVTDATERTDSFTALHDAVSTLVDTMAEDGAFMARIVSIEKQVAKNIVAADGHGARADVVDTDTGAVKAFKGQVIKPIRGSKK